nr:3-hydroxyacyl-CoA dehydrogenase family protein [Thermococcus sp. GR6]
MTYPGLRLISVMIAIATELAHLDVAKPKEIDTAFKLGTNISEGPFEFLKDQDLEKAMGMLNDLHREFKSPIFDVSKFQERIESLL